MIEAWITPRGEFSRRIDMLDNDPHIDAFVTGVQETTGLLSKVVSRKFAAAVLLITLAVLFTTVALR